MDSAPEQVEVAVVGTGFSGLGSAIALGRQGIASFVLLEKADRVGGTWRDNSYPGAACDIPSHLYSFSFEPNAQWSRAFSPQEEILRYLERCAAKYGLDGRIRFGFDVDEARFDEATGTWLVRAKDGRAVRARSLILGNGALHLPSYPAIDGREAFAGKSFHSARWDHGYDLAGKTVAVVGTGASAIQFVPRIAPSVKKLYLFQRTPPWIVEKPDRAFSAFEKLSWSRVPLLQRLYRAGIYLRHEWRAVGFVFEPRVLDFASKLARRHLEKSVDDPALRAMLTPNYRMGCKRILISNDYYPAVQRANVEIVTAPIDRIGPSGVHTDDGAVREVDAIIYGTGFSATRYLSSIRVVGAGGRELNDAWGERPRAFLGITVAGFPNLYLLMGPNTVLGHNSMIFMLEAQARYAVQGVKMVRERNLRSLEVRADVEEDFQHELRRKLGGTVWATGCKSWYLAEDGSNPVLWPGFTFDYWWRTRRLDPAHYAARP
jgi:cation diffusion facilitator CzcD-associated flavoprotein CzcO